MQEKEKAFAIEKARTQALQERAFELQEAYEKLRKAQSMLFQSEKMAAVGRLAGGIAHEINNPMGVILGFAQSIVARIKDNDPLYNPLKSIEREAVRCRKLVVDLLTFSRMGRVQAESIDINQTIDETLSLIESQSKLMNIKINKAYGTGLTHVRANKNQIQQVVVNICNNAIDAMPAGGIITITTKQEGRHIMMEIADTGKGMNEEVRKHMFEPFYTTKEVGKGTGLGLSLCFEIIQQHDGIIEFESEEGKGATFRVKIPII
jgi:signal transduction histidine kinase